MTAKTIERQGYLRQAWLVILLAFLYGGALAGVHVTLAPRIAENKRQETYGVIPLLVDGAVAEQTIEVSVAAADGEPRRAYKTRDQEGRHNGWVLPASGQGFADTIELLIGLNPELTTITGLYVLEQRETPGLGDYIRGRPFGDLFEGAPADTPLAVVKSEPQAAHEIRAISGATVSSLAVCEIVNATIAALRQPLSEEMENRQPAPQQESDREVRHDGD